MAHQPILPCRPTICIAKREPSTGRIFGKTKGSVRDSPMSFWSRYSVAHLLSDFLDDAGLVSFSCVNRRFHKELRDATIIRKRECVEYVMHFFHRPETFIFSLNHVHKYERNLRRLFLMLPEWFAYMEEKKITYLDLDCPVYSYMQCHRFDSHIIEGIMGFLEQNRTLLYCNLGLFYLQLSRRRLQDIMMAHPSLYHLEMTSIPDLTEPTSLYRREDGQVEWRYTPQYLPN